LLYHEKGAAYYGPITILERYRMKKKIALLSLAILTGAALGYSYYYFVGCRTGACPITSNPYISTVYGAIIGVLIAWSPVKR
jgi:hypothetical protein